MPFYKRSVVARGGRPAVPLAELRDVCSLAALTLLRQLADLCGHSLALLGDIEGHVLELGRRTGRLHRRAARLQALLRGRPLRGAHAAPATSNLDLESKKAAHTKLSWQQPVNVFLAAGRPPGMEQLHQEAQLNLQSLLQEEYEEQYAESRVTGQTFRATGHLPPDTPPEPSPRPLPAKRLEFVLMPPSQRATEEETVGTTALGARAPSASLSLPTSPDKQPPWTRAFHLPTVEEKQWNQSCSIQTNIVPINVSGQHFARHASARHSLFNTETAMNPKSTLRRRRTIIGFPNLSLRDQGSTNGPAFTTHTAIAESLSCSFVPEAASGGKTPQEISPRQPLSAPLRKTFSDLGARCCQPPAAMDSAASPCAGACNGPQGTPFPPPWSAMGYVSPPSLAAGQGKGPACASPGGSIPSPSPGSPTASFFIATEEHVGTNGPGSFSSMVPESPPTSGGGQRCEGQEARVNFLPGNREELEPMVEPSRLEVERAGCRFRERSLSVPTDSGSLCSVDIAYAETRRGSANYALGYPSASSEGSTSTDNVSLGLEQEGQRRRRSKSISLKKAKKKPSPPTRSVSLIKEEPQGHRLVHADPQGRVRISLKGKTKVSRHHSDSTFGTKLAQKTSPIAPIMPVVTQSDLRSVRLRSISRSEPEDNADSPEHAEEPARGTTAKEKGLLQDSFGSLEDELRPERSGATPVQLGASMGDQAPTPSPIITLDTDPTCCNPNAEGPPSPEPQGTTEAGDPTSEQGSLAEAGMEKSFASDKTADSITEEDDDVFMTSRTTEDLFTVIHRSKRKVLGRKEPGDTFGSRPNSHSPVKTLVSPTGESPAATGSTGKSSSRNEDFKALLQKKSSKTSPGTRPSATELLKTTNPLARRVMMEFAPELDGANSPKSKP
ncbi:NHS-like protein 2 isoform B [Patagioenas fasciata monilis]|uniref:NHS-like protein 2 isoform B n=1 Tax=Patagioenas fasciata monilis TaxID=372326 RepID=A0A1V4KNE9_PATFA|nr:NHS-like protein 2 isoform B [Patagioenas fasciata monilis]